MGKLEYDGVPQPTRRRKLVEQNLELSPDDPLVDKKPPVKDDRQEDVNALLRRLAGIFAKGEALKRGLSKMDPAQSIPIDQDANSTVAAATRLFKDESQEGKVITYSMYQKSIDFINDKKWEVRRTYFRPSNVIAKESVTKKTSETTGSKKNNFIKEFLDHSGLAGSIIAMLVMSPYQNIIFQALGVEQGAKTAQSIQVPVGIALFIELGIKAEKILQAFKGAKISTPLVEQAINDMQSPDARAKAFDSFGLDYNDFKKSVELQDHENIVNYVSEYYARYGGLVSPDSHLSLDHWIAYLTVSQNQHTIRGCLNTADSYSEEFSNIRDPNQSTDIVGNSNSVSSKRDKSSMSVQFASSVRLLNTNSSDMYDSIVNAFMYQVSDRELCCLVSIFGANKDTDMMKTISSLLKLLAADLSINIVTIDNIARQMLSNFFASAIFELCSDVERMLEKVLLKLAKIFTVDIPGLEACTGLLTLGYAIMESIVLLYNHIKQLLKEILSSILAFGQGPNLSWNSAADRRHLSGIAKVLDVIAARFDAVSVCDSSTNGGKPLTALEAKDIAAGEVIHTLLDKSPPSLQLTNQEIDRYFPNVTPQVSSRLGFTFGIPSLQNLETNSTNCTKPASKEEIEELGNRFSSLLRQEFI